ncbi:bifunctional aspartate kinase/homoserine dehydrogenase II [Thalassomonas sp. M1454]|uniref:bifunctional aspartate kinase/homoserine dehydrogenase II n=1 Tax=Thalassomonas sp. M1454 TaxID=2594477 RepID=UPI00117DEE7A|nr:bifunctional aspartate kinase/homoserine dehydrogenase II [Thalassomonas sp. M1454]TRX57869.1 aspartate kinase [Thalassomonas sp. M1454]
MSQQLNKIATEASAEPLRVVPKEISVHKFGGSSLANAQCIERVVAILKDNANLSDLVVVSANGKTTDQLFALLANDNDESEFNQQLELVLANQQQLISELLSGQNEHELLSALSADIDQIKLWRSNIELAAQRNNLLAFGEVWSARLLAKVISTKICPANAIDARQVYILDSTNNFQLDESLSQQNLVNKKVTGQLNILTGFIASDEQGRAQTLGRNGSDFSATIAAHLLNASNTVLWTDIDGIYSADPRVVPNARKLHRLENSVAKELGRLGNPVLHANTLNPLATHNIHLHVASSFAPTITGTEIGAFGEIAKQEISVTHNNDLLYIHSDEFTADILAQIELRFQPLYQCVDQTCVVLSQQFVDLALQYLEQQQLSFSQKPVSLIAVVGYNIASRGEIKARFKRALTGEPIAKFVGSENGHSLLAFFDDACSVEFVNKVHNKVTKDTRNIGLVVAGLGNIGQRFLEMLPAQLTRVHALENVHLVGLATSKKALINTDGIDAKHAVELFSEQSKNYDNKQLVQWLEHHPYDELVLVDITPSSAFSDLYHDFFEQGIHVISANKSAGASDPENYHNLLAKMELSKSKWLVNATVGAGLPINYALNDLKQSGDVIEEISGIFSGTLSLLFANFDGSVPFSELLIDALEQGFTEPDPRDDLSGLDVQRKLLILARLAGYDLALEDIACENLVPEFAQKLELSEFLARANELDSYYGDKLAQAQQQNGCLRYIARFIDVDNKISARVGLEILPNDHAFANLTPCDNVFLLKSAWYQDNPLIIRGPGAGRDVTAGGLHSDLVNLCKELAVTTKAVEIKGIN